MDYMSNNDTPLQEKITHIYQKLREVYGEPQKEASHTLSPLAQLVNTILSQNTNDVNRDRAFERLRERFPTWEAVRDAPQEEVIEAIRPAGLANQKGPRIQKALQQIDEEQGELSLSFLSDMPLEEARDWLTGLKGVGPKTAAIVLLFSLERPAFPVDTHVHRVSKRLGIIEQRTSAAKAHQVLEARIPAEWYYPLHLNLIRHGREVCHARKPKCERCPLSALCDFYAQGQEQAS